MTMTLEQVILIKKQHLRDSARELVAYPHAEEVMLADRVDGGVLDRPVASSLSAADRAVALAVRDKVDTVFVSMLPIYTSLATAHGAVDTIVAQFDAGDLTEAEAITAIEGVTLQ